MNAEDIIRAAIPDATDGLCDHVLWGRTPFPFGRLSVRDIYKAASSYRRANEHGLVLCDFCHRVVDSGNVCQTCREGLDRCRGMT